VSLHRRPDVSKCPSMTIDSRVDHAHHDRTIAAIKPLCRVYLPSFGATMPRRICPSQDWKVSQGPTKCQGMVAQLTSYPCSLSIEQALHPTNHTFFTRLSFSLATQAEQSRATQQSTRSFAHLPLQTLVHSQSICPATSLSHLLPLICTIHHVDKVSHKLYRWLG
jgi:hypothetical protein